MFYEVEVPCEQIRLIMVGDQTKVQRKVSVNSSTDLCFIRISDYHIMRNRNIYQATTIDYGLKVLARRRLYLSSNRESSRNLVSASLNSKEKNHELDINDLPLTVPLPGLSKVSYAVNHDIQPFDTKLTLLKTGLKVASEPHFGQYCTIGVAINAGSRYAGRFPVGVPHFVEKLAFSKTSSFSTKEEMFSLLERRGALIDCQSTKDTFIFASSCHINGVKDILTIISDAIMRPVITAESLKDARMIINYENEDMNSKPDCEPLLNDWIHMGVNNFGDPSVFFFSQHSGSD
ncbi:unnamed protein product [Dracunculus medinensis]|uniref:Peptidase_M16 domain-containing protein n=1 Tax=Dracunculus medinensis TaxID=318479 RepID=A0A0N4UQY5_DRAME|nr:unnamed protein product [Dracunculus medinensis]